MPGDDASSRTDCTRICVSPDGTQVAVGYSDGMVRLFDLAKASLLMALTGHKKGVTALAFSADGALLLSGSKDTDVIVWDLVAESGQVRFRGHRDEVTCVSFLSSPGGGADLAVSGSKDTLIKVWDLRTRVCVQTIVGVRSEVWALAVAGGGERLCAGAGDNQLRVWAVGRRPVMGGGAQEVAAPSAGPAPEPLVSMGAVARTTSERAAGVAASKSGLYVAVASAGKTVEVFKRRDSAETRKRTLRRLRRVREKAAKAKRGEEGGEDAGGDGGAEEEGDDTALLGTSLAELDASIKRLEDEMARAAATVVDEARGSSGAGGMEGPGIPIIAGDEFELVGIAQASAKVTSCVVVEESGAPAGGRVYATLTLLLSLSNNSMEVHTLPLDDEAATALGTKTFAAASGVLLPLAALSRSLGHGGHRSDVRAVALSEDAALALTASTGEAKLWNTRTGVCIRTLALGTEGGGEATGLCVAFGPGAKHGFVGTKDGRLLSFDLGSGDRLEEHAAHGGPLWSLAVRPDGKGLATGGADKEVKFWDFEMSGEGGKRVLAVSHGRTLKVGDEVLSLAYSKHADPANLLIAVALLDSTVKLFHDDSLRFFLSLYGHKLPVLAMDVSADGTLLATASADKSVKVWGLDFGDCHKSFLAHSDGVTGVGWVGGTHYFVTTSKDRSVRYWDGDRFERILSLEGYHKGEVWALACARDGKSFVTVGADRSLRTWKRTSEQVFLDEEKDAALEAALERDVRDVDGDEVMGGVDRVGPLGADGMAVGGDKEGGVMTASVVLGSGLLSEATTIVAAATKATARGADRLVEALALAQEEAAKWAEYAEDLDSAGGEAAPGLSAPRPHPELLGLTPAAFILRTLRSVRPSDVDQVLLTLPFADALALLRFGTRLLGLGQGVELVSRAVLLLLRVHGGAISGSPSLLPLVTALQGSMGRAVGAAADTAGFNASALRFLDKAVGEALAGDSFGAAAEGEAISRLQGGAGRMKEGKGEGSSKGVRAGKRKAVSIL